MTSLLSKYKKDIRVQVNKWWLLFDKKEFSEKKKIRDIMEYYLPRFQKGGIVTSSIERVQTDKEYLPVRLADIYQLAQIEVNDDHFKKFYDYNFVPMGDILIFYYPDRKINLIVDGVHRLCNRVISQSLDEEVTCHYLQSKYLPKASIDVRMILERI
jgi:hypothetical protein